MAERKKDRVILHCDMNAFYASVELLDRPDLAGKPVAVCGSPETRHGIILAKNQPAKEAGVVTAETVWQARRKCPDLQLLPPHRQKYIHYSRLINQIYLRYTDLVEPFSIDESWLDVTASQSLFGNGQAIADAIRETVKKELHLTLSAGVSYNKIFAKMGSDYKKPDATTVITRQNYQQLLWPLPARNMIFVGKSTAEKLQKNGIHTIGDMARHSSEALTALLGKQGRLLWDYCNGLDDAPVSRYGEGEPIKSIGNGITFRRNLLTDDDILTAVTGLCDTVASRLRKSKLKAFGIKVDIKDPSLKTISRQKQLLSPTNLAAEMVENAMALIRSSWPTAAPIRMLTITAIHLFDEKTEEQLSLFGYDEQAHRRGEQMERTMDDIRNRFGSGAIAFGGLLGNDIGLALKEEDDLDIQTPPDGD